MNPIEKIIITIGKEEVTATQYSGDTVLRSTTRPRSWHGVEYDVSTVATCLMGVPVTRFTGKVVCVKVPDNNHWFEVGRVYLFEDGITKNHNNIILFHRNPIVDIYDLNGRMTGVEFVKLLED